MEKKTFSAFALALRSLLDDHGIMRRSEWAEVLGVSEAAISQWVNDAAIPKAENLRAIINTAINDRRVPAAFLDSFEELLRRPSIAVTPNGDRMKPTLAHYLVKPLRDAVLRTLDTLPPEGQQVVLAEASAHCRRIRSTPVVRKAIEERRRLQFEKLIEDAVGQPATASVTAPAQGVPVGEDRDLAAQAWMQGVLITSLTGATAPSIAKPLSIARKASLRVERIERSFDEPLIWLKAEAKLRRGVRNTMIAANVVYLADLALKEQVR
jgi:transcriptional regulator with XRE-family HTH domain